MSVSSRLFWELVDTDQVLDFVQWLRKEYPIMFKNLAGQFNQHKEISSLSARSKD